MGRKFCIVATVFVIIILLTAITGTFLHFYWEQFFGKKVKRASLVCYVCQASRKLNATYGTNYTQEFYYIDSDNTSNKPDIPITSFEQCLYHPKRLLQCQEDEFCAIIQLRYDEIENVERKCLHGDKLGCETKSDYRIGFQRGTCLCETDGCIDLPFQYEKPVIYTIERFEKVKKESPSGNSEITGNISRTV